MNFEIYIAAGLLMILVLIKTIKSYIDTQITKEHFNNIAFGIFLLALAQLAQFFYNVNAFSEFPFISDQVVMKLFSWSVNIYAMILILRSVSVWLPLSRKHIESRKIDLRRAEMFKRVIQLLQVEKRPLEMFKKTIKEIVTNYSLPEAKLYLRSVSTGKSRLVATYKNSNLLNEDVIGSYESYNEQVVPIEFDSVLLGCIKLKCKNTDSNVFSNIKLVADLLGKHIKSEAEHNVYDNIIENRTSNQIINTAIEMQEDTTQFIKTFLSTVNRKIDIGMISVIYPVSEDKFNKLTVSTQNMNLIEKNASLSQNRLAKYVIDTKQIVSIKEIAQEIDFEIDPVIAKADFKSQLTMPLKITEDLCGAMTFASYDSKLVSTIAIEFLKNKLIYLEKYFLRNLFNEIKNSDNSKSHEVNRFNTDISALSSLDKICKRASENFLKNSSFDIVRISLFDKESDFIRSIAVSSNNDLDSITPEDASLFLPMMPYHQMVRDKGVQVNVDKEENKLSESEMSQIAGRSFESMSLIPILFQDKAIGVITFVSLNRSIEENIDKDFIRQVTTKTNYLSMLMSHHNLLSRQGRSERALDSIVDRVYVKDIDQVKSSLSGIIGSVEMLKSLKGSNPEVNRVLNVMDRSTKKISNCLKLNG